MYTASESRYSGIMPFRRSGNSGLVLPALSIGLWHNFGSVDVYDNARAMALRAFDIGITHFDLANNYGPLPGSAEETFGKLLATDLKPYRDELIISTKAGYGMWPGPYGDHGSRKYLIASLDQSLKRMGLDYVDIFYHHRPDYDTPLEESMRAVADSVKAGKALYAAISNYPADRAEQAIAMLKDFGTPCLIHQASFSMLNRWVEHEHKPNGTLVNVLERTRTGLIAFSPLAQGMLTNKYLHGVPDDSRAAKTTGHLQTSALTPDRLDRIKALHAIAERRGQTLAQMAIAWLLAKPYMTSVLIGASRVQQIDDCAGALRSAPFTAEELAEVERVLR
jgi:L-glyceraldehyde 3-phosphate reductase